MASTENQVQNHHKLPENAGNAIRILDIKLLNHYVIIAQTSPTVSLLNETKSKLIFLLFQCFL